MVFWPQACPFLEQSMPLSRMRSGAELEDIDGVAVEDRDNGAGEVTARQGMATRIIRPIKATLRLQRITVRPLLGNLARGASRCTKDTVWPDRAG